MDPSYQNPIDSLLERYLILLDEYTRLRTQLSDLQTSVFQDIARANFAAERGLRFGQDQYDQRMQASRVLRIASPEHTGDGTEAEGGPEFRAVPVFEAAGEENPKGEENASNEDEKEAATVKEDGSGSTSQYDIPEQKEEAEDAGQNKSSTSKPKDPLRWFGLFTPATLRNAQTTSIQTVEQVIPRLVTVNAEMLRLEIEVRRVRKRRAKAEAGAGKEGVRQKWPGAVAAS